MCWIVFKLKATYCIFSWNSYIQLSVIFIHSSEAPGCQPIPCCPENSTSVYLTEGPYISEVKVGVNVHHVIRNRVVVIETIIKIPKLLNISKGNRIVECGMMLILLYLYWFSIEKHYQIKYSLSILLTIPPPQKKKKSTYSFRQKSKADIFLWIKNPLKDKCTSEMILAQGLKYSILA